MERRWLHAVVDRETRLFKLYNVLMYGGFGAFYFYSGLLLARRGVNGALLGAVLAMRPAVGLIATPLWTALADAYDMHRTLLCLSLVAGSSSRLLYVLLPPTPLPLIAGAFASEFLVCAIVPLSDGLTFVGLERLGRSREEYALQRLWGAASIGWVVLPVVGGLLTASPREYEWHIVLAVHIGLCSLAALVPIWSVGQSFAPHSEGDGGDCRRRGTASRCSRLLALRRLHPHVTDFARCVVFFACGAFHAATEGYLFLYLDALHATEVLDGVAITLTCVSEVIVMALASRVRALLGVDGCLVLVCLCYVLRFIG